MGEILAHACGTLLQVADMLAPFLPGTAQAIQQLFITGVVPHTVKPLFPRIYLHTADPRSDRAAA